MKPCGKVGGEEKFAHTKPLVCSVVLLTKVFGANGATLLLFAGELNRELNAFALE